MLTNGRKTAAIERGAVKHVHERWNKTKMVEFCKCRFSVDFRILSSQKWLNCVTNLCQLMLTNGRKTAAIERGSVNNVHERWNKAKMVEFCTTLGRFSANLRVELVRFTSWTCKNLQVETVFVTDLIVISV